MSILDPNIESLSGKTISWHLFSGENVTPSLLILIYSFMLSQSSSFDLNKFACIETSFYSYSSTLTSLQILLNI